MSRIDPAEFDRLARKANDAQKQWYDSIRKAREAEIECKVKQDEFYKASQDFQKYVHQHTPAPPPDPNMDPPLVTAKTLWESKSGREKLQAISAEIKAQRATHEDLPDWVKRGNEFIDRLMYAPVPCCEVWEKSRVFHDGNCGPMNRAYELSQSRLRHGG